MKHPLKYLAFFLLLFPLAGCLGEPSGEDLRAAVERSLDQDAASLTEAGKVFGEAGKTLMDMLGKKELHGIRNKFPPNVTKSIFSPTHYQYLPS